MALSNRSVAIVGGAVTAVDIKAANSKDVVICVNLVVFALDNELRGLRCDIAALNSVLSYAFFSPGSGSLQQRLIASQVKTLLLSRSFKMPLSRSSTIRQAEQIIKNKSVDMCVQWEDVQNCHHTDGIKGLTRYCLEGVLKSGGWEPTFELNYGTLLAYMVLKHRSVRSLFLTGFTFYDADYLRYAKSSAVMGNQSHKLDATTGMLKPRSVEDGLEHNHTVDKLATALLRLSNPRMEFDSTMSKIIGSSSEKFHSMVCMGMRLNGWSGFA
jgi:hypothetical protein